MPTVLTVTQLNNYAKSVLDFDDRLKNVYVTGEISNFTDHYRSGHLYMTLKDEGCAIRAVMFKSSASKLRFKPQNSMKVIVRGSVTIYERDGAYQLYISDMQPDGVGALAVRYEQLKRELEALGMFSEQRKKPIKRFPGRIGVVTSPTGAAVEDILSVLSRRYPVAQVVFCPVKVQGDGAAEEISQAIKALNYKKACDVIIVGRGGGSIEDLWAFNEREVANAVFESDIPVISAVGHETDYTICDFVSDLRAPTPSAAAELAVPDARELLYSLDSTYDYLTERVQAVLSAKQNQLKQAYLNLTRLSPQSRLMNNEAVVNALSHRLSSAMDRLLDRYEHSVKSSVSLLDSLNPTRLFQKGYALVSDESGGAVRSVDEVSPGQHLEIRLSDGRVHCKVKSVDKQKQE